MDDSNPAVTWDWSFVVEAAAILHKVETLPQSICTRVGSRSTAGNRVLSFLVEWFSWGT